MQGPFSSETMAECCSWGYFTDDLRVRNVAEMPDGVYVAMGVLFPDPCSDANDAQLEYTAPFEGPCWRDIWRKHAAAAPAAAAPAM